MCSTGRDPQTSAALPEAARRWSGRIDELMLEGQCQGEVREGSLERIGLPVFATLRGSAGLVAAGLLAADIAECGRTR
ncbi:hypothetical protein ABZ883_33360 [Streptomyces sp. NPDC046977]|uniref:hypothetical protein n=1 Tax=Streptomyces sp. NPDC046977 TaxID=3154703 RepID=UPI0033E9622D